MLSFFCLCFWSFLVAVFLEGFELLRRKRDGDRAETKHTYATNASKGNAAVVVCCASISDYEYGLVASLYHALGAVDPVLDPQKDREDAPFRC